MTVGIQVYRGGFALAIALRIPGWRVDAVSWLLIAALVLALAGLPWGVVPGLLTATLALAVVTGMFIAEVGEWFKKQPYTR
jgi:hypothetical protein